MEMSILYPSLFVTADIICFRLPWPIAAVWLLVANVASWCIVFGATETFHSLTVGIHSLLLAGKWYWRQIGMVCPRIAQHILCYERPFRYLYAMFFDPYAIVIGTGGTDRETVSVRVLLLLVSISSTNPVRLF